VNRQLGVLVVALSQRSASIPRIAEAILFGGVRLVVGPLWRRSLIARAWERLLSFIRHDGSS